MARSQRSNKRPDTLMQDRSPPTRRSSLATHGRTIHRVIFDRSTMSARCPLLPRADIPLRFASNSGSLAMLAAMRRAPPKLLRTPTRPTPTSTFSATTIGLSPALKEPAIVPDSALVNSIQTTGTLNAHSNEQRDGERPKRGYGNGIDPDYRCTGAVVWRRRILWSQPRVLVIR